MRFSFSAEHCFRRCQRQFYFRDIAAWHNSKDPIRREAYVLKQLKTLELWQGGLVHRAIERWVVPALRSGTLPNWDDVVGRAHEMAHRQFCFSEQKRYRDRSLTKTAAGDDFCALLPHELGVDISAANLGGVLETIERSLRNLKSLDTLWNEFSGRQPYYSELPIRTKYEETNVEGYIDLLYFRGPGRPTIVDWKVSRVDGSTDARVQAALYAWILSRMPRWSAPDPSEAELLEVRLLDPIVLRHRLDAEAFEALEDRLYRGICELREIFGTEGYREVKLDHLAYATSPGTCFYCSFQQMCVESGVSHESALG